MENFQVLVHVGLSVFSEIEVLQISADQVKQP